MITKKTFSFFIFTLTACVLSQQGFANSADSDHVVSEEAQLINSLAQLNPMDHDYRLKRDAAVVAFGCDTIPFYNYDTRRSCYLNGVKEVTEGVNFDRIILNTCEYVSSSKSPSTFSDCVENISKKMNYAPLKKIYEHCEGMRNLAIWEKPKCYKNSIPELENSEEKLPKVLKFEVKITGGEHPERTQLKEIQIQQHIPPRSDVDLRKLTALSAACSSLNTGLPETSSRQKKASQLNETVEPTDSEFRETHCYFDGLKALVKGTTVPGVILASCEFRLFGNQGFIPAPGHFRDYKQICMESGVRATQEANLTGPLKECEAEFMRGARDLGLGLHPFGLRNCTESFLSSMDAAQKAIQAQEEIHREKSPPTRISNWDGVKPENQTTVTETLLNEATKPVNSAAQAK